MAVTLRSILDLPILKKGKERTGMGNLEKEVRMISVIDNPVNLEEWQRDKIIRQGDFFITSFHNVKDDEKEMLSLVEFLDRSGVSGICVIDQYIKSLPPKLKAYAEEHDFCIILIDWNVLYADVIHSVMELIFQDKLDEINALKIDLILESPETSPEIPKLMREINRDFGDYIFAVYVPASLSKTSFDALDYRLKGSQTAVSTAIKYREGILIFCSFEKEDSKATDSFKKYLRQCIREICPQVKIAVSSMHQGKSRAKRILSEVLLIADHIESFSEDMIEYDHIGIYGILLPLVSLEEFQQFCLKIFYKIRDYDLHSNTSLLETMDCFIGCNGDYKRTAQTMFQHENTIRHRIDKVQEILGMTQQKNDFYVHLYIAIKGLKLMGLMKDYSHKKRF